MSPASLFNSTPCQQLNHAPHPGSREPAFFCLHLFSLTFLFSHSHFYCRQFPFPHSDSPQSRLLTPFSRLISRSFFSSLSLSLFRPLPSSRRLLCLSLPPYTPLLTQTSLSSTTARPWGSSVRQHPPAEVDLRGHGVAHDNRQPGRLWLAAGTAEPADAGPAACKRHRRDGHASATNGLYVLIRAVDSESGIDLRDLVIL